MNKKFYLLFNYILIFLGFLIFCWLIWARFIRERLPKSLPFLLSEFSFFFIIYICLTYLVLIILYLFSKKQNEITKKFIEKLYLPLVSFDKKLKYNKYIKNYYDNFMFFLIEKVQNFSLRKNIFIILVVQIFPRLLLISIFLIDVFYYNKLELIYKYIFLGIFPLLYRYYKYSLKQFAEEMIERLEVNYCYISMSETYNFEEENSEDWDGPKGTIFPDYDQVLPLKDYVKFKTYQNLKIYEKIVYKEYIYETNKKYDEIVEVTTEYFLKYLRENNIPLEKLKDDRLFHGEKMRESYNFFIKIILDFCIYKEIISFLENKYFKMVRVIIYLLYLLSWLFILIYSYRTFPVEIIEIKKILMKLISMVKENENPFL